MVWYYHHFGNIGCNFKITPKDRREMPTAREIILFLCFVVNVGDFSFYAIHANSLMVKGNSCLRGFQPALFGG